MIKKIGLVGLAALAMSGLTGCRETDTTEVGLKYCKFACIGDNPEMVEPGQFKIVIPFKEEWYTYETAMQTLYMVADPKVGDRERRDDLQFKTKDGNNIGQDVVMTWKIDYTKAAYILENVGENIEYIQEKVVRPVARTVIRDHLNNLTSTEFYDGQGRFHAAKSATEELKRKLAPYGIVVDQINVKEFRFGSKEFQTAINDAENARQDIEKYTRQLTAVEEKWKSELEKQIATSNKTVAEAEQYSAVKRNEADGKYAQTKAESEALLKEKKAEAESTKKLRQAMASHGGDVAVQRAYAESFAPENITILPCATGSDVTLNKLDLNALIAAEAAKGK